MTVTVSSMEPSYKKDDQIYVDPVAIDAIKRGDVVVFNDEDDETIQHVKRVIGLPGESIRLTVSGVEVDSVIIAEPYLKPGTLTNARKGRSEWNLKADELFVLGDARDISIDSRSFGPVKFRNVIGRVTKA